MGFKSGKANTLTSVGLPGPGAVTMLSRPVEKSTKPVAMLTPERSSPYGLNVEKSAGTTPAADDSWDSYTFTSLGTTVATNRSPLPSYRRTSAGLPGAPGTATA